MSRRPGPIRYTLDRGEFGRPHLRLMRTRIWSCRDECGGRGYGATKELAYNEWVHCVQFVRLGNGYYPAPLNLVHVTLPAPHK